MPARVSLQDFASGIACVCVLVSIMVGHGHADKV